MDKMWRKPKYMHRTRTSMIDNGARCKGKGLSNLKVIAQYQYQLAYAYGYGMLRKISWCAASASCSVTELPTSFSVTS